MLKLLFHRSTRTVMFLYTIFFIFSFGAYSGPLCNSYSNLNTIQLGCLLRCFPIFLKDLLTSFGNKSKRF